MPRGALRVRQGHSGVPQEQIHPGGLSPLVRLFQKAEDERRVEARPGRAGEAIPEVRLGEDRQDPACGAGQGQEARDSAQACPCPCPEEGHEVTAVALVALCASLSAQAATESVTLI